MGTLKIYIVLTIIAIAICIISTIFKFTKVLIIAAIAFVLFGLRTGVILFALDYEAPVISAEAENVLKARPDTKITLTLPNVQFFEDKDSKGFGLDGVLKDDGTPKTITNDSLAGKILGLFKKDTNNNTNNNDNTTPVEDKGSDGTPTSEVKPTNAVPEEIPTEVPTEVVNEPVVTPDTEVVPPTQEPVKEEPKSEVVEEPESKAVEQPDITETD